MTDKEYFDKLWEEGMAPVLFARLIGMTVLVVFAVIVLLLMTGCQTKYIAVPEYHMETVTQYKHDSIFIETFKTDSVVVHEGGDTVTVEKWHWAWRDRWHDVVRVDSFIRTDSIRVPYPVERKLSKWERVKMDYGATAIGVSLTAVLGVVAWILIWIRRRFVFHK